jgi:Na+/phosphate symporter
MASGDLETARGQGELHEMGDRTVELLRLTWSAFRGQDAGPAAEVQRRRRELRSYEKSLTQSLAKDGTLLFVPLHLERIGGDVVSLMESTTTMVREGVPFTDRAMRELNGLFERAVEQVECARDAVLTGNRVLIRHIVTHGLQYAQLADDYALAHQQRLAEGLCVAQASSIYLAMIDYLKGVESHTRQIGQQLAALRGM